MKNRLVQIVLLTTLVLQAFVPAPLGAQSPGMRGRGQGQPAAELRPKFASLRALIEEKKAMGQDVSRAMELGRQSREAAQAGDLAKAEKLIDEAIASLKGAGGVQTGGAPGVPEPPVTAAERPLAQRTVELDVASESVVVTSSVPDFRSGKDVGDGKEAFTSQTVKAFGGKVGVSLSSVPVIVEEVLIKTETQTASPKAISLASPFGGTPRTELQLDPHYRDLGVKWIRYSGRSLAWDVIERKKGVFDWSISDALASETVRAGINPLFTVRSMNKWDQPDLGFEKGKLVRPKKPTDLAAFLKFLEKAVERYDGDGVDDAPGSPIVSYWQIENEVDGNFWGDTLENYALLLKASYKTVKKANPDALVLIAGASSVDGYHAFHAPLLKHLRSIADRSGDRYFDVFDLHWYGYAGDYRRLKGHDLKGFLDALNRDLSDAGYRDTPVWITETGTHGGSGVVDRSGVALPAQNESVHAAELVRRFATFLGNGVRKVFWTQMTEVHHAGLGTKNDYFENIGLVNNPENDGDSSKKLAYHSYQLLISKLEGSAWDKTRRIDLGDGVHAYRFTNRGRGVFILWQDAIE